MLTVHSSLLVFGGQVDVTNLVAPSLRVADPDVAQLLDGGILQGRSVGTTDVQVSSMCIAYVALL